MADKNLHIDDEKFDLRVDFRNLTRSQSEVLVDAFRQMARFVEEGSTEWICILVDGFGDFEADISINDKPAHDWNSPQRGYYSPVRFRNSSNRWVREEVYKCVT